MYQPLSVQSEREYRSLIQPFGIDKRQDATGSEPLLLEEMEPVMVSTVPARRVRKICEPPLVGILQSKCVV